MKKIKLTKKQTIIICIVLGILIVGTIVTICLFGNSKETDTTVNRIKKEKKEKVNIVDVNTESRPYAVMVNNDDDRVNNAGLQDAYIIYDIIEEGGITRNLALFLDQTTTRIGNVRSVRHYYLDYVAENDAILCHNGQSPQAANDFGMVDRIEIEAPKTGIRDNSISYSHSWNNLFTSIELIEKGLGKKRTKRNNDLLLNYSSKSVDISNMDGSIQALKVNIPFSRATTPSYEYDEETKSYKRYINGVAHTDAVTKRQYTFKNIITYQIENYMLDDVENKGRQGLNNIGSGKGYYISEGYAVPITWEKSSRTSQTVYKYLDGQEIIVNDGNTFIELQPTNQEISIS